MKIEVKLLSEPGLFGGWVVRLVAVAELAGGESLIPVSSRTPRSAVVVLWNAPNEWPLLVALCRRGNMFVTRAVRANDGCGGADVQLDVAGRVGVSIAVRVQWRSIGGVAFKGPEDVLGNGVGPSRANHRCGVSDIIWVGGAATVRPVVLEGVFLYSSWSAFFPFSIPAGRGTAVDLAISTDRRQWKQYGREVIRKHGKVRFFIDRGRLLAECRGMPARLFIRMTSLRDGSTARGSAWVLNRGTGIGVFDIDGTLTTGNINIVLQLSLHPFHIRRSPVERNGARDLVRLWFSRGYLPVYLSGRAGSYYELTKEWLSKQGFPAGPIEATHSSMPTLPIWRVPLTNVGVGSFKISAMRNYTEVGQADIRGSYGNVETDIRVNAALGIPPSRSFIIGKHGQLGNDFLCHASLLCETLEGAVVRCPNDDPWWF